jgi:glutamine amidotransferase
VKEELIHIIDYGVGNLGSVARAFGRLGVAIELTSDPDTIRGSRRLVLPGVGHFGESMTNLRQRGLEGPLREAVKEGASLLGICVGFQMLFDFSEEAPGVEGLGLLPGTVKRFPSHLQVPHIGWNQLELGRRNGLLEGIKNGDYFYFLHSYYIQPDSPGVVHASTDYGVTFCSVGLRENIAGIQFHPEKSQDLGLVVLRNFYQRK